jgi:hypothetical protein
MTGHIHNAGVDTEEHLQQVKDNYDKVLALYRAWAIRYAHIIYRIGDDDHQVWHMVSAYLSRRRADV